MSAALRSLGRLLLLALLFFFLAAVQSPLDRVEEAHRERPALLYMPNRAIMKVLACGQGGAVADVLMVRATNYLFREFGKSPDPAYLNELFQVLTELDPEYCQAYVLGGLLLSAVSQRHDAAVALWAKGDGRLLELDEAGKAKGLKIGKGGVSLTNSGRWTIALERASYLVSMQKNNSLAGGEFLYAAHQPGCSQSSDFVEFGEFLIKASKIDPELQIRIQERTWKGHLTSDNESLKAEAQQRLEELATERVELELSAAVSTLRGRGIKVEHFAELRRYLRDEPKDPLAGGYRVLADGRVVSLARAIRALERRARALLMSYRHRTKKLAESLAQAGLTKRFLPDYLVLKYDPKTGTVEARIKP